MKPTSKEVGDPRKAEQHQLQAEAGERVDSSGLGEAMVDALADILKWERASERSLRVAKAQNLPN